MQPRKYMALGQSMLNCALEMTTMMTMAMNNARAGTGLLFRTTSWEMFLIMF